ncbi:MAG: hypothetical protein HJJLKODD_02470 [Phycisphaerae bacterium]|nr:hypothetical protein [Phycisphaerae bacterium]
MAVLALSHPRYCAIAFPPYTYIPGQSPHPITDPQGHSHRPPDTHPPAKCYFFPHQWTRCDDYLYGCDLYNHGYWWEAHEAWEAQWQLCDKSALHGQFLQTLIQVAAAHLQLYLGKLDGVHRTLARSTLHARYVLEHLDGDFFMGLNFRTWYHAVTRYQSSARQHALADYPYIALLPEESI